MYNDKQTTCLHAHENSWLLARYYSQVLAHRIIYVTRFAKRDLIRAIINIEKSCFVLECMILSMQFSIDLYIRSYSVSVLFNGLLAEFPASFFTSTTIEYIRVVGLGWWGAMK